MNSIVIITDVWSPKPDGVVSVLESLIKELKQLGHNVQVIEPSLFKSISCPWYAGTPIVYKTGDLCKYLRPPCAIHIATEGTLGLAFNRYCSRHQIPFTTAYHTNLPEYAKAYFHIPHFLTFAYLRSFHKRSQKVLVATDSLISKLSQRGFANLTKWSLGVDLELFRPSRKNPIATCLYVGRVAKEKNLEAFLDLKVNAQKIVVGSGPYLNRFKAKYRDVQFLGVLKGEELARQYGAAHCFVFPSKTDTFGLVLIEALACGTPVAAYPVDGPRDIWDNNPKTMYLSENLEHAVNMILQNNDPQACRQLASKYSWKQSALQFLDSLVMWEGDGSNTHFSHRPLFLSAQRGDIPSSLCRKNGDSQVS